MISKILVILSCLFISFGVVYAYGYGCDRDSEVQSTTVQEDQLQDIQYQLDEVREQLEQQQIRDQLDRLYDDCDRDCYY